MINSSRASFFAAAKAVKGFSGLSTISSFNSTAQKCIQNIFRTLQGTRFSMPRIKRIKIELIQELVSYECLKVEDRQNQFNDVYKLMDSVPTIGSIEERLNWLNSSLNKRPIMPCLTTLSPQLFLNEIPHILYDTTQLALYLNEPDLCKNRYKELNATLTENMHLLVHNTLLSNPDLTSYEAMDRGYGLHPKMSETAFELLNNIVDDFISVHGGDKVVIRDFLKPAMMRLGVNETNPFLQQLQQERVYAYLGRSDIINKSSDEILQQFLQSIDGELDSSTQESCDSFSPAQRLRECIDAYLKRPNAQTQEIIILACVGIQQTQEYKAIMGQISCTPKHVFR